MRTDEEQLGSIVSKLRDGAGALDRVARGLPDAVDAGFSSDVANAALARVGKVALALAQQGDTMASNVDAAKGVYRAGEETNKNEVETTYEREREQHQRENGPLNEAEPESDVEQGKNSPAPTTETAPAPTPPPEPSN